MVDLSAGLPFPHQPGDASGSLYLEASSSVAEAPQQQLVALGWLPPRPNGPANTVNWNQHRPAPSTRPALGGPPCTRCPGSTMRRRPASRSTWWP